MDGVSQEDLVVPRGRSRTLAYAIDRAGRRHAREFLSDVATARARARFFHAFTLLAEEGRIHNERMFRKERGDIWGFKADEARIAAFPRGRVWFLTHGFLKKRDRWHPSELERAERIRWEHLTRRPGGGSEA